MKKNYKTGSPGASLRKGFLTASLLGAVMMSNSVNAQNYCVSQPNSTSDDEIFNVTFGPMNNTSSCGSAAGPGSVSQRYSNYTVPTLAASNYTQGTNYPLSVTVGQCGAWVYGGYVGVWIDYNQDGDFTDPGEQVWMSSYNNWQVAGTVITAGGGITIPASAIPGLTRMRVIASESQQPDPCNNPNTYYGYGETEDYSVNIISNTPCNNSPAANTVVGPANMICPNTAAFLVQQTPYLIGGLNYQWYSSTNSNLGPWTAIPSATNSNYMTPNLTVNTWYVLTAQCINGGSTTTLTAAGVSIAPTTINTVPYEENFEGVQSGNNELPNCSWTRTNPNNCRTSNTGYNNAAPNSGNGFAFFDYGGNCTSNIYYFYSNGIQMNAGITYSASVWYKASGWSAYSEISLHYGPNQSPTGLTQLGIVNSPNSSTYKSISNTFQVATSGVYYMAIRATDNCGFDQLSFDDLRVIAPCTYSNNAANLSLTAPVAICSGQSANLTASGVSSYSWNTGATSSAIVVSPTITSTYSVTGTNSLSGCAVVMTAPIMVNPLPGVQIYVPNTSICEGETVTLSAFGSATSFTWTAGTNPNQSMIQDAPMTTTTYSVIGANSYGCMTIASQVITVNQLPAITVNGNTSICKGEPGTLTGVGGDTYSWSSASGLFQTNPITPYPQVNTTYTVTGTDVNGCEGTTIVNMIVNACTGISTVNANIENLNLYPNPNNGEFTIELNNGHSKTIEVMDVTGRTVVANSTDNGVINVNISQLANGIYYVKVKSDNAVEVLKVVKQ